MPFPQIYDKPFKITQSSLRGSPREINKENGQEVAYFIRREFVVFVAVYVNESVVFDWCVCHVFERQNSDEEIQSCSRWELSESVISISPFGGDSEMSCFAFAHIEDTSFETRDHGLFTGHKFESFFVVSVEETEKNQYMISVL